MPRALAPVLASLAAIVAAAPAAGQSTEEPPTEVQPQTLVLNPIQTTRHRLIFTPESLPAEGVTAARVRLHRRGHAWTRGVPVTRVQTAAASGLPFQVHKRAKAGGRLKVKIGGPEDGDEEPPPASGVPSQWDRVASFESSLNGEVDYGWRSDSPFNVTRTDEAAGTDGSYAAKIVTNGGDASCSCPRMTFDGFSYGPNEEVWISGSWRIPNPSKVAWSRLMNLGHYEGGNGGGGGRNWYLGLESVSPGEFQVSYAPYSDPHHVVLPARTIPANRWFRVDLHFRLSPVDGRALTEWFIDGELVDSTTKANMLNSDPLHFYNSGLSYFWSGNGNTTVFFDSPRLTSAD